ncbi:nucleotidyltransferase domain-containing protein [Fodinicola feengrottensis]|uniref:Nucleotidyltransferase domain-containing protein n=1 Tax=Fodinicola feengrottensis TaxID=435914 RepID=A0ABN2HV78_9ACTN|nr:nucleotidyltransferase domain-containing protein [Fodinicola feengrottensis]
MYDHTFDPGTRDDQALCDHVAVTLAGLPGVRAVALGGSRAAGTHRPDSDWDFAVYYRGGFNPDDLRAVGWPGEVSDLGGWGGGVFNGGGWMVVDGRHVDVHYRDLDDVERRLAQAKDGVFDVEQLMFHLAGVPTYIVVAELALNRVLRGRLPQPRYPGALSRSAYDRWSADAGLTLSYAQNAHAVKGHVTESVGAVAVATCQAAHAIMAARREWVTNEKTLVDRARLRDIDDILAAATADRLTEVVERASTLLTSALELTQPTPED